MAFHAVIKARRQTKAAAVPKRPTKTVIRVRPRPGCATEGLLRIGPHVFACRLGRTGLTAFKREGDGATPIGRMRLVSGWYRADRRRRPDTLLRLAPAPADAGWCDDMTDGRYNRPVRLPCRASHETIRRDDGVYDVVVVLDWNLTRRTLGRGSAIFLHLTRPEGTPTAGCVAVSTRDMDRLLKLAGREAVLAIGR
jgi:L,D-peptidoglycan transpeptidase YkuD (ErfK/YbiS/YcfS/YnhG family)